MRDNKAGLEGQSLMQLRKLVSSVSEGGVTLEGLTVEVEHGVFEKFMSLTLAMVATGQEMVREKSGNFTFSQGKFTSLKKVREK